MRESILEEESKEISPIKTFDKVVEYFSLLRVEFFRGELKIVKLIKKIINAIKKLGREDIGLLNLPKIIPICKKIEPSSFLQINSFLA